MRTETFFQSFPPLKNPYEDDRLLKAYLHRILSEDEAPRIEADLQRFGERIVQEIERLGREAEAQTPVLENFDAWGRRIDALTVSPAWEKLHAIAAEEGLLALGYERQFGATSRVYQFAKLYLFTPSSAFVSCPLAMSDGAARLIEVSGDSSLKGRAFRHLTSRDPRSFWTSGQWMTERRGGSDVGGTETRAILQQGDVYKLYGAKWFTSATSAQMAMTLARIEGAAEGSRGLSLFYLETRTAEGELNGIRIQRLKDKLGSKALPTAELELDGCLARRIGPEGQGVRQIASLFNVTRIYNAMTAVSFMRRTLVLARSYAEAREAFGHRLIELPLHAETLAQMEIRWRAAFALCFSVVELMGRVEMQKEAGEEAVLLRLMTPVVKLLTAKEAMLSVTEFMECIGGAAYVENTGLSKWLRDTQVLAIWEGTTNVLSLDVLRALQKEGALPILARWLEKRLGAALDPAAGLILKALKDLEAFATQLSEASARDFAISLGRIWTAQALREHALLVDRVEDPLAEATLEAYLSEPLLRLQAPALYTLRQSLARG